MIKQNPETINSKFTKKSMAEREYPNILNSH